MEPSLDQIREHYRSYSDDDLTLLATTEARRLRPDVVEALEEELRSRGLPETISHAIDAQIVELSEEEIQAYCERLQSQPCPVCGAVEYDLNATVTKSVVSLLIITLRKRRMLIACPDCLDQATKEATIKSALLGWWGFPWGIIRTIQAISSNNARLKQHRIEAPNDLLRAFVVSNVGKIEMNWDNEEELQVLIANLD
jgi:hypothetical protein